MESAGVRDRLWLWLCLISLLAYLALSASVRAFGRELSRLVLKL
jgi:hypothetical protein